MSFDEREREIYIYIYLILRYFGCMYRVLSKVRESFGCMYIGPLLQSDAADRSFNLCSFAYR